MEGRTRSSIEADLFSRGLRNMFELHIVEQSNDDGQCIILGVIALLLEVSKVLSCTGLPGGAAPQGYTVGRRSRVSMTRPETFCPGSLAGRH
jgi:hypothetical protein